MARIIRNYFYRTQKAQKTQNIRDLEICYLYNKINELVLLQIELIKGRCPGALHLEISNNDIR